MSALRIIQNPLKGRCVITDEWLRSGSVLEVASVQPLKKKLNWNDPLYEFAFEWNDKPYVECIAFGMISMVNHSGTPNASIKCNFKDRTITLRAIQDIQVGREICFNYDTALWFRVA